MNDIVRKSEVIAYSCAKELGLTIISVEYVYESGVKILRVIADRNDGLSIDDATALNELISIKLDEADFISEEYYLEVSSEGIEKELKNDQDIINAISKFVCLRTYEKILGAKEIYGDLLSYQEGVLKINAIIKGRKQTIEISKEKISRIRLAVKF